LQNQSNSVSVPNYEMDGSIVSIKQLKSHPVSKKLI